MGTYVMYSLGGTDGLQQRFLTELDDFIDWLAVAVEDFPDDFAPGLPDKARDMAARGALAFQTGDPRQAWLIDRVVDEYWNFCDLTSRYRQHAITTAMHKRERYAADLATVLPAASDTARALYRKLFAGRSLARCEGHAYASEDGVFHLSWLAPEEGEALLGELASFEAQLDRANDHAVGVLLLTDALRQARRAGRSLVVAVA